MYDREALIELIRAKALEFGEFTLASGKKAHYYLDCRQVALDPRGANLIASGILDLLAAGEVPDAIGGLAIGADPVTAAVVTVAGQRNMPLRGFMVRKESKAHGRKRLVEGPVFDGDRAVIVEDVITSGGSALQAIDQVEAFGMRVLGVVAVVDRLEGGGESLSERGYTMRSLLNIQDLVPEQAL